MNLNNAVELVVKNIKEDPGYRRTWQANIAMAFKDEFERQVGTTTMLENKSLHMIANKAADNFLNNLCYEVLETGETPSPHNEKQTKPMQEGKTRKGGINTGPRGPRPKESPSAQQENDKRLLNKLSENVNLEKAKVLILTLRENKTTVSKYSKRLIRVLEENDFIREYGPGQHKLTASGCTLRLTLIDPDKYNGTTYGASATEDLKKFVKLFYK